MALLTFRLKNRRDILREGDLLGRISCGSRRGERQSGAERNNPTKPRTTSHESSSVNLPLILQNRGAYRPYPKWVPATTVGLYVRAAISTFAPISSALLRPRRPRAKFFTIRSAIILLKCSAPPAVR